MKNLKKLSGIVALALFAVSSMLLIKASFQYARGRAEYQTLLEAAEEVIAGSALPKEQQFLEGKNYLLSKNTDYIGWIQIEGTKLSYPIVREREDGHYLTHTFSGEENPSGSIFMDQNSAFLQGGNTILYGHNMKDGSMFGSLKKFQNTDYLKDNCFIQVFADGEEHTFRIFACVLAKEGESLAYTCSFGAMEDKLAFIDQMKQESIVNTEYMPQPADLFLTLSTCIGPGGRDRLLIVASMPYDEV